MAGYSVTAGLILRASEYHPGLFLIASAGAMVVGWWCAKLDSEGR